MNFNYKLLFALFIIFTGGVFMGSFLEKPETKLNVIMAGVDEKGNSVCVNKNQVYLFKKLNGENKIIFHYHDVSVKRQLFQGISGCRNIETYWDQLIRNW